jgi:1,4-dihydroxy-2-naphthoate octaprenyltransferase
VEYLTLTRNDPEFESYLLGTFAKDRRAIPVETFEGSVERVTFRLVPLDKLDVPAWWRVYLRSCRPELVSLTLGPAVAAWLNHYSPAAQWTRWPSWFALIGIFFLHTAAFLYNDYQGHVQGSDRVNRKRGSQVIQNGWVTAAAVKKWAWVNAALALLFGLPAFLNAPLELAVLCVLVGVALAVTSQRWGQRWGFCDLAMLLLFGPLLTCGIALASFASFNQGDIALGFAFGLLTLWVFHVRQFGFLFRSKPDSFRTFLAYFPFDRARLFVVAEAYLALALQLAVGVWLRVPLFFLGLFLLAGWPLNLTVLRLWRAESPLASPLVDVARWALLSHLAWSLWWMLALGTKWL